MKNLLTRFAVAILRLAGHNVTYTVSRRLDNKQTRGFGRVHFADGSLGRALRKANTIRCGAGATIYVRLDATVFTRIAQLED